MTIAPPLTLNAVPNKDKRFWKFWCEETERFYFVPAWVAETEDAAKAALDWSLEREGRAFHKGVEAGRSSLQVSLRKSLGL